MDFPILEISTSGVFGSLIVKILLDYFKPKKLDTNGLEKSVEKAIYNGLKGVECPINHNGTKNKIDEIHKDTEKTKEKTIVLEVHTKNMVDEQKTTNKLLRDLNKNLNQE